MSLSNLPLLITKDSEGNCCPRLVCTHCHTVIADAREAIVEVNPGFGFFCAPCSSRPDERAMIVPLTDFLVCLYCNAGLDELLHPNVGDELVLDLTKQSKED